MGFCCEVLLNKNFFQNLKKTEELFTITNVFSDMGTLLLSGNINRQNIILLRSSNPHAPFEATRGSLHVSVRVLYKQTLF